MRIVSIVFFLFVFATSNAQKPTEKRIQAIKEEAAALYILERASDVSLNIFYDNEFDPSVFKGYVSYKDKDSLRTLFYTDLDTSNSIFKNYPDSVKKKYKEKVDLVLVVKEVAYGKSVSKKGGTLREETRPLNTYEKTILDAKFKVAKEFSSDTAKYKRYEGTTMSYLFLDYEKVIRVYLITLPNKPGVLTFGNDYYFEYDKKTKELIKKEKIHQIYYNISPEYKGKKNDPVKASFHTHKQPDSPFITATDLCLLMLYKGGVEWEQHWVYSEKWVSVYTLYSSKLTIEDRKAFELLSKPPEKDPYEDLNKKD